MDVTEWLEGLNFLYKKYPLAGAVLTGFIAVFIVIFIYTKYWNQPNAELKTLDQDFIYKKSALLGVITFPAFTLSLICFSHAFLDDLSSIMGNSLFSRVSFILATGLIVVAFFFLSILGNREIGSKSETSYNELIDMIPIVITEVITFTFSTVFIVLFQKWGSYELRLVISSTMTTIVTIYVTQRNPSFHNSYTKISNETDEYYVYRKIDNYFLCGKEQSKYNTSHVLLISCEDIAKERYKIFPYVRIQYCYTQKVTHNHSLSIRLRSLKRRLYSQLSSKKRRAADKKTRLTNNQYQLQIKLSKGSASIYNITVNASFKNFWGRKLYKKTFHYNGVINVGEEKCIRRFKVKNSKVYQCKLEKIDFIVYNPNMSPNSHIL